MLFLIAIHLCSPGQGSPAVQPLTRSHAHNDYAHSRPLEDALDQGFCSVEADIFLVDGKLLVGHDRKDLTPERTLDSLYLAPLAKRVKANRGHVYPQRAPFTLLIDIKENGAEVYKVLATELDRYRGIFSGYDRRGKRDSVAKGKYPRQERAITAILSGDRPVEAVRADNQRLVFIDGRLADFESTMPFSAELTPLVSESYFDHFKWIGGGKMPDDQREKLRAMADRVHRAGARFRLWAIPDNKASWAEMHDAGVDLINTDHLPELANFLRTKG